MRKKSILMVCISALIALTMFVGCDNAPVLPSFVVGGSIEQSGDFLIGQKFDPSKFSVTVRYSDGSSKKLADTSIVTLQGTGDTVAANSVVEARLGLDYDNVEYIQTAGVSAYSISAIEVTGPETVTATTPESAFTVTAKYLKNGAEMTMVLNTQEYKIEGISSSLEDGAPVVVTATSELAGNEVSGSYNAVFSGKSTDLPEGAEIESISAAFVKDFSFNQLNYGDEAPAIDGSRIKVTAKVVGDETEYNVASSDVEFSLVDAQGLPLINYNFLNVSQVYVKASYEGFEAITQAVDVFEVTVSVQLAGFEAPEAIYAGGELPEITGVRYVWETENGAGIIPADEVKLVYAYTATAEPTVEGSTPVGDELVAGNYLMVYPVYKGVATEKGIYLGYVETPATTIESVEFSMAEGWKAPAKQYYKTDKLPSLTKTSVVDIVVTTSVGVEEYDSANDSTAFTVAYYTAEGKPLSEAKATEGEYDVLANVDSILVGLTLGETTYYESFDLSEPAAITTLKATANEDGATSMVGETVDVVVVASNGSGAVDKDFTAYSVLDSNGAPCEIDTTVGANDVTYTIYATDNVSVETTLTIYAGKGYYAPKNETVLLERNDTEMSEKVGTTITEALVKKYFVVDTDSYNTFDGEGEETAPAISGIDVNSKRTLVTGDNVIPVIITYVGSTGETVEDTVEVTIVGTAYVSDNPTFSLTYEGEPISNLVDGTMYYIDRFDVDADSYNAVGVPELVIDEIVKNQYGASYTGTFTADSDFDYIFTVTYLDQNLDSQPKTVTLDTVAQN